MALFKWVIAKLIENHAEDVVRKILDWLRGDAADVGPFASSGIVCPCPEDKDKAEAIAFCEKALEVK